ncbi:MAG: thiamine phosphate synthase [Mycobacteriales bacterium]
MSTRPFATRAQRAERLARARLYLCTAPRPDEHELRRFAADVISAGVDIVQVRDKRLDVDLRAPLVTVAAVAARLDALSAANDWPDLAQATDTDILHVGQADAPPRAARQHVREHLIGLSTRNRAQVDAAVADPDVDYFCVGPVWETPTKPGRPAAGLALLRHAADVAPPGAGKPWFAIGGIDENNLDAVLEHGARRIVVVRAITESPDPATAAARLAVRLRTAASGDASDRDAEAR